MRKMVVVAAALCVSACATNSMNPDAQPTATSLHRGNYQTVASCFYAGVDRYLHAGTPNYAIVLSKTDLPPQKTSKVSGDAPNTHAFEVRFVQIAEGTVRAEIVLNLLGGARWTADFSRIITECAPLA